MLYVADRYNHAIRAIDISSKAVTTFAGTGSAGSADGASARPGAGSCSDRAQYLTDRAQNPSGRARESRFDRIPDEF